MAVSHPDDELDPIIRAIMGETASDAQIPVEKILTLIRSWMQKQREEAVAQEGFQPQWLRLRAIFGQRVKQHDTLDDLMIFFESMLIFDMKRRVQSAEAAMALDFIGGVYEDFLDGREEEDIRARISSGEIPPVPHVESLPEGVTHGTELHQCMTLAIEIASLAAHRPTSSLASLPPKEAEVWARLLTMTRLSDTMAE